MIPGRQFGNGFKIGEQTLTIDAHVYIIGKGMGGRLREILGYIQLSSGSAHKVSFRDFPRRDSTPYRLLGG